MAMLPGQRFKCATNETCEDCDKPATWSLVGECDSFGCEYVYLCDEHLEAADEADRNADHSGFCEWCKTEKPKLSPRRDIDEGSSGPVYYVCSECIQKDNDRINEELDYLEGIRNDYDDEWDDHQAGEDPVYTLSAIVKLNSGSYHYDIVVSDTLPVEYSFYPSVRRQGTTYANETTAINVLKEFIANHKTITIKLGESDRTFDLDDVFLSVGCQYGMSYSHGEVE